MGYLARLDAEAGERTTLDGAFHRIVLHENASTIHGNKVLSGLNLHDAFDVIAT